MFKGKISYFWPRRILKTMAYALVLVVSLDITDSLMVFSGKDEVLGPWFSTLYFIVSLLFLVAWVYSIVIIIINEKRPL